MGFQVSVNDKVSEGYLKRRHSIRKLVVLLIFTTKYHRKIFDRAMTDQIWQTFLSAAKKLDIEILGMDGEADHVHLLVADPPKRSASIIPHSASR